MKQILLVVLFVLAVLMAYSSASACSDLNGDGVVSVADFLIFVNDFGKTDTCGHAQKVQLVIQNQFNDAVWDTSRNAAGVLTITITKKPPPSPPPPPPVTTPVNTNDRDVLIELYNTLAGENWKHKGYWLSDRPLNEWLGVSTTKDGRVDSLNLGINNLSGSIPESLSNLTELEYLNLYGNNLSGPIPESLRNLRNLKELWLNGNEFSGSIPESLGNLRNLEVLDLSSNDLSGPIPKSLDNLRNLKELWLGLRNLSGPRYTEDLGNDLTGTIPEWLGNLTNLRSLDLTYNEFSGSIPESLGNLRNLRNLYLKHNKLSGPLPESFANLTNLSIYTYFGNQDLCLPVSLYDWARGLPNVWNILPDCN